MFYIFFFFIDNYILCGIMNSALNKILTNIYNFVFYRLWIICFQKRPGINL